MSLIKRLFNKVRRDGLFITIRDVVKIVFKKEEKILPLHNYSFTQKGGIRVAHVSAYNRGNMGDTYLPVTLKNLINNSIPVSRWVDIRVETEVTDRIVRKINKSKMCLIGGGGLFLRDTHANDVSGWQWNCSIPMLEKINVPIVMFAVGYNRFRGQEEFKPIFKDYINKFVEKAAFVGLRNHGSIENVRKYLTTEELKKKIVYQPCMTTLTSILYPDIVDYSKKDNIIGLNCAFDRSEKRQLDEKILDAIAVSMKTLSKIAQIKVLAHMQVDLQICPYLDKHHVKYESILFEDMQQMIKEYSRCRLVIGMRGHAQMIPFGCHSPILSIVSHDKMQWFLDDIHCPDWGVDVANMEFEEVLTNKAMYIYDHYNEAIKKIEEEQSMLYKITEENIKEIVLNSNLYEKKCKLID